MDFLAVAFNTFFSVVSGDLFSHFARGGGSGSGGSGGGGGGVFMLGYLPTYFLGRKLRQKRLSPKVAWPILVTAIVVYGGIWAVVGGFIGYLEVVAVVLGGLSGYLNWLGKVSAKVRKKASKDLAMAAERDSAWNNAELDSMVQQRFLQFQQDWSNSNIDSLKKYLSPNYYNHIYLMLAAIKLRQRQNRMSDIKINEIFPMKINDSADNNMDTVTYYIDASATDELVENVNGKEAVLFTDKNPFVEYWNFVRKDNNWYLDGIDQATSNPSSTVGSIKQMAKDNGMYYSADWGWLLLPTRGQLFKKGKFGTSDINNHVIGMYKNVLMELYTYIPANSNTAFGFNFSAYSSNPQLQYTVAQAALPKRYDSLIVEAKKDFVSNLTRRTPKGYNKITLEWPDFNKRYFVFATNAEQVTAFELLHPAYMEKLFALPFKLSIEVVDNVVYLYTTDAAADYKMMYDILQEAFKEMRL